MITEPTTRTSQIPGFDKLAELRDELRVKLHLGGMEARQEWDRLEPKWQELEKKAGLVERASIESLRGLKAAADLLVGELYSGYERIRKVL